MSKIKTLQLHTEKLCYLSGNVDSQTLLAHFNMLKPNKAELNFSSPLHWESGFAYGRRAASPDSENIEFAEPKVLERDYSSVEQIQDRIEHSTQSVVSVLGEGSTRRETWREMPC